ncbi:hypothetical protein POM88_052387 [Heracleum sosnowskyi]|uniref:Uncharacterized protein n=1 Tax=Heracleum sosnowskyi TaxID=360622 RepID=A0AAD8LYM8_9APIA|nr:hypothetical protein POM88_052387 [Heracleum sosnowskyi]
MFSSPKTQAREEKEDDGDWLALLTLDKEIFVQFSEDEDCSIPESSSRMKIIRRVSGLLSFTARAFSVNGDAKTSGYKNRNSFLSLHHWVRRKPWNQEEVLQSSKLKRFTLNDISKATNKFDSVLGEGGFGRVYKGWVKENTFAAAKWGTGLGIAVKSSHGSSAQGYKEWLA